jgi:hypothetical protein
MGLLTRTVDTCEVGVTGGAMTRFRAVLGTMVAALGMSPVAFAHADPDLPAVGIGCTAELADAMTLLPDQTTYVACRQAGLGFAWAAVQTPFPPNDTWLSYGPAITLHGQAMRNPNLSSGRWTATPRSPDTTCRATQTTVVEAGVLAQPQVFESEQGKPLLLEMLPRLFYAELAGDCLWVRE